MVNREPDTLACGVTREAAIGAHEAMRIPLAGLPNRVIKWLFNDVLLSILRI